MIEFAEFTRFRGFEKLRVELAPHAYLVGPNSAGKSTVLEAIGLAKECLRASIRRPFQSTAYDRGEIRRVMPLPTTEEDTDDPVRFEFGREEARVSVHWKGGASIHMVWPEETGERESPFFYLEYDGPVRSRGSIHDQYGITTIIPVVAPLDRLEDVKNEKYIQGKSSTRLASRHFRNHAFVMQRDGVWPDFKKFCQQWLPEIELLDVKLDARVNQLGVFYAEPGSRVPKELAWAGDGIQIWVQLLWHLFRSEGSSTIVLDEPEVYLHPDLQRRLVRILDASSAQIVLASHSSDVIAEAPPEGVLWIDRRAGKAQRPRSQKALAALSASLGSSYNLALARSMRSRLVIASDCQDLRVLRILAKQIGAVNLANEHAVSMIQLRESSSWATTEGLGQILRDALPRTLPTVALLQTGYRPQPVKDDLCRQLTAPNMSVRFWVRNELENYLLDPETIAKVSGAAPETVELRMVEACADLRDSTKAGFSAAWLQGAASRNSQAVLTEAEASFDKLWSTPSKRIDVIRGTEVLRQLNAWFDSEGYRLVSTYALAKAIKPQALESEVFDVLLGLDEMLV